MNKSIKSLILILNMLLLTQATGAAMETKIKFDEQTYNLSNPDSKNGEYTYLLKDENISNWHTKVYLKNLPDKTSITEASADFAYGIQSEHPSASVLVYPEAGTVGYLLPNKNYFEYNTIVFHKGKKGLDKFGYAKRFYASENGGLEGARKAAINFAEKNNKKYMELANKTAPKYKVN